MPYGKCPDCNLSYHFRGKPEAASLKPCEIAKMAMADGCSYEPPRPLVVNFHDYGNSGALDQAFPGRWVYVGRTNRMHGLKKSPLANPYSSVANPKSAAVYSDDPLRDYRKWLWGRIQAGDLAVMDALNALDPDSVLVCWCWPADCHAEIIAACVRWLHRERVGG